MKIPSIRSLLGPVIFLFEIGYRYSKPNQKDVIKYWIMFIVANTIGLIVGPLVFARMINIIQVEGITNQNFGSLVQYLSLLVLLEVVFWLLHGPARVIECTNGFRVKSNYKKSLLKGVLALGMDWHSKHHSGDTIDKISKGTDSLSDFMSGTFEIIYMMVQFLISCIVLAYFNLYLSFVVIAMIVISGIIVITFDRILILQYDEINKLENKISENIFDCISNITTVIILRVGKFLFDSMGTKIDEPYAVYRKNCILSEIKWFLINMCCIITTVIVLSLYFYQHLGTAEGILIGNIFLLHRYLDTISNNFYRFCGMYSDIVRRHAKVRNSEILSQQFTGGSLENHFLKSDWKQIEVSDLCFSYPSQVDDGFRNLDSLRFVIRRGEKIAFLGKTGSGKTTTLKLIRGLYSPARVIVNVDGREVAGGFEGISNAISLIPQTPEIFATTVLRNVTFGVEQSMSEIDRYADICCFLEDIRSFPDGWDTHIGERGVNLSGGQQQRLALARGLFASRDKDIILLDEPTSSIDPRLSQKVMERVMVECKQKTVIAVLHNLSLLRHFDYIYIFEGGRIVSQGSSEELQRSCRLFQEMWSSHLQ